VRRVEPCLDLESIAPMSLRVSRPLLTCPSRASHGEAAITALGVAPAVAFALDAMPALRAPCMIWVTRVRVVPSIWSSVTPSITAAPAITTSLSSCLTWPGPSAITPAASRTWLSDWLLRTVCLTKAPVGTSGATSASSFPSPPSRTGSKRLAKKKWDTLQTDYLDEALADFSGYLAIDEVYDGSFCILSVVDNRRYNRLSCRVLDHKPTQDAVRTYLKKFKEQLDKRGLLVQGITTDGSSLYPKILKELWPDVPHQLCVFHILKEITKAVLHALAKLRKEMRAQIPKQKRGRPKKQDKAQTRRIKRLQQRVAELFEQRYLFVRHHLSAAEKKRLKKLLRGQPQLRALRAIMDEVYRLFDRRCKSATALQRLAKLRQRVRRFKRLGQALTTLNSPNLEKALLFLDDKLLGATSNAVERANRRFRKAQQSIYSVRTKQHLQQRLALDMNRELRAAKRARTLKTLHHARSDPDSGHRCCYSLEKEGKIG
jgi:hypothetical protein